MSEEKPRGFWSSVPGILTGLAAIITAVTSAVVALYQADFLNGKEATPHSNTTAQVSKEKQSPTDKRADSTNKQNLSPNPLQAKPSISQKPVAVPNPQPQMLPNEENLPSWIPIYPFAEQKNILLRSGVGSFSFETGNSGRQFQGIYAGNLQEAGWKVETGYDGIYWLSGALPEQQRFIAVTADQIAKSKTNVVISFLDNSLASVEEPSVSKEIPNWVPIYPGKVEKIKIGDHNGGFYVTTADSGHQVQDLYATILRVSGYEVTTDYTGIYYVRGTAKSQGRSIVVAADREDNVTTVEIIFNY